MSNIVILKSYAKLNLYLEVLGRRKDNYHNIRTLFERIGLFDKIILKSRRDKKIRIICHAPHVPKDSTNLCYRSAKLLQDALEVNKGVDIKIIKRIPVGAGLGGGSSNAAVVLEGLNKIWRLGLKRAKLVTLAKKIGSDVPFFLYESPFAEGTRRGDKIRLLPALNKVRLWHILIVPGIKVSTPVIYREWDKLQKGYNADNQSVRGLTRPEYNVKLLSLAIRKKGLHLANQALFNSLEQVSAGLYPEITRIKERFKEKGVKSILMSGSGPAVFGILSSRKEAVSLGRQLKGENRFWQVFVTRTA